MDDEYIPRKIKNCKDLISNATSEAQKEAYREYLDKWIKRLDEYGEIDPVDRALDDQLYEKKFPNKRAYYKRNGKYQKTRGYKEFLKSLQ